MGYRDTGGGSEYVPTTDIDLGILRHQADEHLRDVWIGDDMRIAWEHVLNVLAVVREGKGLVRKSIDDNSERVLPRLAAWAEGSDYE